MTHPATTEDMLLAAVAASPADEAPRAALCDHYEETGRPDRAEAARWLWAKRRRPFRTVSSYTKGTKGEFAWGTAITGRSYPFLLPLPLFVALGRDENGGAMNWFDTAPDAYRALLDAWERLGPDGRAAAWASPA